MRLIARFFGFVFATGAILFVVGACAAAFMVWKYQQDLPDYTQLKNYEPPVMTRVHANDGSILAEYARERRLYLPERRDSRARETGVHFGRRQEFLHP